MPPTPFVKCFPEPMGSSSYAELDLSASQGHGAQNTRTPPNCARCRNHNEILPLKGHKRYCKYIRCECDKCLLTAERQKVMALQTAQRRAEEQDRQRLKNGLPVPSKNRMVTPPLQSPGDANPVGTHDHDVEVESHSSISMSPGLHELTIDPTSPRGQSSPSRQNGVNANKISSKELWDTMEELKRKFKYPAHVTPLLYILMTEVTKDVSLQITSERILQAIEELRTINPLMEEFRHQRDHTEYFQPWAFVCPDPGMISHSSVIKHYNTYRPLPVSAHRFQPYPPLLHFIPPCKSLLTESMKYLPFPEANGPSVLVPSERIDFCCKSEDRKRGSPSSFCSDKSSLSGSLDT